MQRGSDSEEDRPFVVSTLRVKRKKEKKMERKEGVWSKKRVSFRTSLMRNNNVAYTSTPSGCRLPSSRLYSSGVFFEYSSFYPRPSTHYFASATDHEKNCTRIESVSRWKIEETRKVLSLVSLTLPYCRVERQNDETSNNINCSIRFSIKKEKDNNKYKWKNII